MDPHIKDINWKSDVQELGLSDFAKKYASKPESEIQSEKDIDYQFTQCCENNSHKAADYLLSTVMLLPSIEALATGIKTLINHNANDIIKRIFQLKPILFQEINTRKLFLNCVLANNVEIAQFLVQNSKQYASFNKVTLQDALNMACHRGRRDIVNYLLNSTDFSLSAKPTFYTDKARAFIEACKYSNKEFLHYIIHDLKIKETHPDIALFLKNNNFSLKPDVLAFFEFERNYELLQSQVSHTETADKKIRKI